MHPVLRPGERVLRYALTALLALLSVVPFVFMSLVSLEHHRFISGNPLDWLPTAPTLSTYADVLALSGFARWLFNSLFVAVVSTLAVLLVQSMAAYAFARKRFPGRRVLFFVVLAGLMVPGAMTLVPLFLIARDLNMLNAYSGLIVPTLAGPLGACPSNRFRGHGMPYCPSGGRPIIAKCTHPLSMSVVTRTGC